MHKLYNKLEFNTIRIIKQESSPNGEILSSEKIHTDKELAKLAGVGTESVKRCNKPINANDRMLVT